MGEYNFQSDLAKSHDAVKEVGQFLANSWKATGISYCNDASCDIICAVNHKTIFIEVKEDFKAAQTGNIAVEFECRGKPSGIASSQATHLFYWIHSAGHSKKLVLFLVEQLKKAIELKLYKRIAIGGDPGSNTKMYLFPVKDLELIGGILCLTGSNENQNLNKQ